MRAPTTFVLFLSTLCAALAQQPAGWSTYLGSGQSPLLDPFYIAPVQAPPYGPAGYVQASCTLGLGVNKVIVVMGQSLFMNTANDSYVVTNPTQNLTFNAYDGNCYQTKYTMVGTQSNIPFGICCGSALARMGDNLIVNHGVSKVIIVPPITGQLSGSLIANWINPTVPPYTGNNIAVIARRLAATGLVPSVIVWEMGTSDATIPTSQAAFTASLQKVIAAIRSVWPSTPILINTESYFVGTTNAGIQAAQASVIDNVTIFAGANTDTIGAGERYDNIHFNAAGAAVAASLLEAAVMAH